MVGWLSILTYFWLREGNYFRAMGIGRLLRPSLELRCVEYIVSPVLAAAHKRSTKC